MAKIIAGTKSYEIVELELGEFRLLKREFGLSRMDQLDPRDPDHLVGYIAIMELRENPNAELSQIVAEVEAIKAIDFEDDGDGSDPSQASAPSSPEPTPVAPVDAHVAASS